MLSEEPHSVPVSLALRTLTMHFLRSLVRAGLVDHCSYPALWTGKADRLKILEILVKF